MKTVFVGVATCVVALVLIAIGKFHANNSVGELSAYTKTQLQKLIREGYQYAVMCDQDNNPLVALMHCCAALNYLEAAQRLCSGGDVVGADIEHFRTALGERLNYIVASIGKAYPKIAVQSQYSPWAGWKFT